MAKNVVKYSDNLKTYWEHLADNSRDLWSKGQGFNIPAHQINTFMSLVDTVGETAYPSYAQFHEAYKQKGLTADDLDNYLTTLYRSGRLDLDTYKDALNSLEVYEEKYGNALKDFPGAFSKEWFDFFSSGKSKKEIAKLYEAMTEGLDVYDNINTMSIDELADGIRNSIIANAPTIAGPVAPTYNEVRTGTPDGFTVGDVPLWTGQELADLNKTNYDPNHYYDIIKQGTEANVLRDRFGVNQRDIASRTQDSRLNASYLDSIRNTKSEAIAAGATRGARAANEMLATNEAIGNYADKQSEVRQTNYDAMLDSLLANASAQLTAQDYFNNLANTRYNEGIQFYANDTDSQGQELLTDAELYSADMQDRAQAVYANALMNADYNRANANITTAQNAINGAANEYAWLFKTFANANNGNLPKTVSDMDSYIFNRYTGQNNVKNFTNAINK